MRGFAWLTAVESAEPVGIPVERISMIEQKARGEGLVVAIHLDVGKEVRVVESLERVRELVAAAGNHAHSSVPRPARPARLR